MHAETIKKIVADVRKVFTPSPCPQGSAFDKTPPPLCGRLLWAAPPRQQKFRAMNGTHLASPIRVMLIGPSWAPKFIALLGTKFGAHQGKKIFALTVGKFAFSNSGNFGAKTNPPKPRSCPKRPFGQ